MKKNSKKLEVAVNEFLLPLQRLSFDEQASYQYSLIRTNLELKGQIIGSNDLFISAHAKSLDAVLVTNNTTEFQRVENLKIEDWTL